MSALFLLFALLITLVFGQARVIKTQGHTMSEKQLLRTSLIVNIGWFLIFVVFIYLGINYSWLNTIISLVVGIIVGPLLITILPLIYVITPLWPIVLFFMIYLEFFN
jgi:hypothetical protein